MKQFFSRVITTICTINVFCAGFITVETIAQTSKMQSNTNVDLLGIMEAKIDTSQVLRDRSYTEGSVRLAAGKETIVMLLDWKKSYKGKITYYQCVYVVDKLNIKSATLIPRSEVLQYDSKIDCPFEMKFFAYKVGNNYNIRIEYTEGELELPLETLQDWLVTSGAEKPKEITIAGIDFSSDYRKIKSNLEVGDFTLRETYFQKTRTHQLSK